MRRRFTLILSLAVLVLGPLHAQIIFDPATYDPGSLPAGMTIIEDTATGTKYLKAPLDGWNTSINLPAVVIADHHTRFKVRVKYVEGTGGAYNWDNVNTFLKLATPGWVELKASGQASDTSFKEFIIDGFVPGSTVGVFQFAGQERTGWSAIAEDTLIIGRITIENTHAILDPMVADTAKLPDGWTVENIDGTDYYKVYLNGWSTSMGVNFTVPADMKSYRTYAKYKVSGTHGYTIDQINTFIKVTDWSTEFTIGAGSSATIKRYARAIDAGYKVTGLQLAGQQTVSWGALVGDTLWLSALVPDWVDSLKLTSEGDATTIDTDLGSLQMHATTYPSDPTNGSITWSVSNEQLAEIDQDGLLSAFYNGQVTVFAQSDDPYGAIDSMHITLANQVTGRLQVDTIIVTCQENKDYIDTKDGFLRLNAEVQPANAFLKTYKWSVSSDTVATINQYGRLTAIGNGTVTAIATADDEGHKTGEFVVTVTNQNLLDTLMISSEGDATTIDTYGGTLQLYVDYAPDDADITDFDWSMSPAGLATIDANNTLTAKGDGMLTIWAISKDGSGAKGKFTATLSNQVRVASIDVHGSGEISEIPVKGGTLQMVAVLSPTNPSNPAVTWTVDDENVATIDANTGLLTAVMDGDVEVTATSQDPGGVSGSATITISGQAINVEDISGRAFVLYPNPAGNQLFIKNAGSISSLEIINLVGKRMMRVENYSDLIKLDISSLPAGIYSVRVSQGDQVHVLKLIKQ